MIMDITNIDSIIDTILHGCPLYETKMIMYPSIIKIRLKRIESLYNVFSDNPDERMYELKCIMRIIRETCHQIQNDNTNTLESGTAQKVIENLKDVAAIAIGAQTPEEFKVGQYVIDKIKIMC